MSSKGKFETTKLKENLEDQVDRLMQQLIDLEENRDDFDDDEYEDTKQETLEQLDEFRKSMDEIVKGDMSLVGELSSIQLIQRDKKIKRISEESADQQIIEILTALKKLGDVLSPEEEAFIQSKSSASMREFQQVTSSLASGDKVMSVAGSHMQKDT